MDLLHSSLIILRMISPFSFLFNSFPLTSSSIASPLDHPHLRRHTLVVPTIPNIFELCLLSGSYSWYDCEHTSCLWYRVSVFGADSDHCNSKSLLAGYNSRNSCCIHYILVQPSVHGLAFFGGCVIVGLETGEAYFDPRRQFASGQPFSVTHILRLHNMGFCCIAKDCANMAGGVLVCCRGRTYGIYGPESN
jgi:hypothetical protein